MKWAAWLRVVALSLALAGRARAQDNISSEGPQAPEEQTPGEKPDDLTTMFRHADWDRFWISGQANFISQYHPTFTSPYQGKNSLSPEAQDATSRVLTLFLGWKPTRTTEFLCDVQETGGHGLGDALGVAGFFNLDVVRNPSIGQAPYIARLMWHQVIPLGGKPVKVDKNPLNLFPELPERRFELRFGKFSMADFFDYNLYGTDSNLQFMNWAVDNNGAYDYSADTRGFTYGALLEYHDRNLVVRFAESLMPKVANGQHLQADLSLAQAQNMEVELSGSLKKGWQPGVVRFLAYVNHANMGVYAEAIDAYQSGQTPAPEITDHPLQTTIKYGFGINFQQPINKWLGIFGRWGWNEGQHESYAYTEVDQTWQIGVGGNGAKWKRKYDRIGLVFVSNGISRDHAEYLALGGYGFLLGDGKLNYGRENILETFYTLHAWRGIFPAAGFQYVAHPGYNRDRGPVAVPTARLHLEF